MGNWEEAIIHTCLVCRFQSGLIRQCVGLAYAAIPYACHGSNGFDVTHQLCHRHMLMLASLWKIVVVHQVKLSEMTMIITESLCSATAVVVSVVHHCNLIGFSAISVNVDLYNGALHFTIIQEHINAGQVMSCTTQSVRVVQQSSSHLLSLPRTSISRVFHEWFPAATARSSPDQEHRSGARSRCMSPLL